jgi:uncharacterized membrane protein YGL010W
VHLTTFSSDSFNFFPPSASPAHKPSLPHSLHHSIPLYLQPPRLLVLITVHIQRSLHSSLVLKHRAHRHSAEVNLISKVQPSQPSSYCTKMLYLWNVLAGIAAVTLSLFAVEHATSALPALSTFLTLPGVNYVGSIINFVGHGYDHHHNGMNEAANVG